MAAIHLINMPFAALNAPSFGLTQIESVLKKQYADRISARIFYLNYDFARYLGGANIYSGALTLDALTSGSGDWFFRQAAFPDLPDNTEAFLRRYHYRNDEPNRLARQIIQEKRPPLEGFLRGLIDRYQLDQADIVGFTSFFSQNVACFAMARLLKERNPRLITVMGGPNCEAGMGQEIARHVPYIDYVFSGPALSSFTRFVGHWLAGERQHFDRIGGVFSKTNQNAWPTETATPTLAGERIAMLGAELDVDEVIELDYGPFLDRLENQFPEIEPVLFFETSRGCWWGERAHCTFCGLNGTTMKYRAMSPENALRQFRDLFQYVPRCRRFDCVDNILAKEYLTEVFPKLDTPEGVTLFYEVKADLGDADMQALAQAGVKHIQPGIEALATSTLKLMRKGTTAFHNIQFLKNCRVYDIYPVWNLLVGFPGEGEEVYRKYEAEIPLFNHLPPAGGVFPVRFDRFSPYYTHAKEYGLNLKPFDFYALTYPFDENALARLAYYFLDHNGDAEYIVVMNRWLERLRARFDRWNALWYHPDGAVFPDLYLKENSPVVYDSRSGEAREYDIGEAGRRLLNFLDRPKRAAELAEAFEPESGIDAERVLEQLQAHGLIFQERGRYLSLVLARQPAPMTFAKLPQRAAEPPKLARQPRKARRLPNVA
ncbi:MAG: RiPP maturation radical SAM protein 1 [Gammaproteobacteria bacterium]|nr:RiPP maturation radical SAM protein 1 [Gammaproteobacteria bacterium]